MRQAVKDDEELDEQRRAARHPDVNARDVAQYGNACVLNKRNDHRDHERPGERQDRERDRHGQPWKQDLPERIDE